MVCVCARARSGNWLNWLEKGHKDCVFSLVGRGRKRKLPVTKCWGNKWWRTIKWVERRWERKKIAAGHSRDLLSTEALVMKGLDHFQTAVLIKIIISWIKSRKSDPSNCFQKCIFSHYSVTRCCLVTLMSNTDGGVRMRSISLTTDSASKAVWVIVFRPTANYVAMVTKSDTK